MRYQSLLFQKTFLADGEEHICLIYAIRCAPIVVVSGWLKPTIGGFDHRSVQPKTIPVLPLY